MYENMNKQYEELKKENTESNSKCKKGKTVRVYKKEYYVTRRTRNGNKLLEPRKKNHEPTRKNY